MEWGCSGALLLRGEAACGPPRLLLRRLVAAAAEHPPATDQVPGSKPLHVTADACGALRRQALLLLL